MVSVCATVALETGVIAAYLTVGRTGMAGVVEEEGEGGGTGRIAVVVSLVVDGCTLVAVVGCRTRQTPIRVTQRTIITTVHAVTVIDVTVGRTDRHA